ncbi:hypothetical protein [Methylophaga sp. SB9B]|uniref:hypothetical protein n=1 Tax=Methylophaga sp. SB9B TaxID=2570356 RepID=UPI001FFECA8F|nr:hypothetical protein [Methylophaga sp. SB9B]
MPRLFFEASGLNAEDSVIEIAIRGKDGLGAQGEVFFGNAALFENDPLTMPLALPEGYWSLAGSLKVAGMPTKMLCGNPES